MNFGHCLIDRKIMGVNVAADLTIEEYLQFVPKILDKNEFQRLQVKSSGKIYDLLRRDLVHGCVIPPIILAVTDHYGSDLKKIVSDYIRVGGNDHLARQLHDYITRATEDGQLLILDGLQRTLTIRSIATRGEGEFTQSQIQEFMSQTIRVEIYLGLSKPGILYRMLTLNTGQTPMSFRHQLEILYNDYIDNNGLPDGISVYREVDERRARGTGKYKYSDVVDMFYAFSTGSPTPYDRQALVTELREMDFLESYKYSDDADQMKMLLVTFNHFVSKVQKLADNWTFNQDRTPEVQRPFGTTVVSLLARPQCMAGYGAEVKRLLDKGAIKDLAEMDQIINHCHFSDEPQIALDQLVRMLDQIAKRAKRIGDSQRVYFQLALRNLFLDGTEAYQDLSQCWLNAQEAYKLQYD